MKAFFRKLFSPVKALEARLRMEVYAEVDSLEARFLSKLHAVEAKAAEDLRVLAAKIDPKA